MTDHRSVEVSARTWVELDDDAYVAGLEELARLLIAEASLDQLLGQVLDLTSRALGPEAAVSVTVVDLDGGYRTAAATGDDARRVDAAQYDLGEGPCVDALETGEEHCLDDLTDLERWPAFRARATELGFGSALSVPLLAGDTLVGALNVFAEEPGGIEPDDRRLARRIAAPAAATLANARAYRHVARLAEQLEEALSSRAVIEQAKGVLMAHARCSPDAAFDRLRRTSQERNLPLREVAAEVLSRAGAPSSTS